MLTQTKKRKGEAWQHSRMRAIYVNSENNTFRIMKMVLLSSPCKGQDHITSFDDEVGVGWPKNNILGSCNYGPSRHDSYILAHGAKHQAQYQGPPDSREGEVSDPLNEWLQNHPTLETCVGLQLWVKLGEAPAGRHHQILLPVVVHFWVGSNLVKVRTPSQKFPSYSWGRGPCWMWGMGPWSVRSDGQSHACLYSNTSTDHHRVSTVGSSAAAK